MIRRFDKSTDVDLLIAGEVEAYTNSYPGSPVPLDLVTNRIRFIERNRVQCAVLDENGPKGYVIATKFLRKTRCEIYIESVYITPELRGRGKLEMLFDSLVDESADNVISLDVSVVNQAAIDAYKTLGFEILRYRVTREYPVQKGNSDED